MTGRGEEIVYVRVYISVCVIVQGKSETDLKTDTVTITANGLRLTADMANYRGRWMIREAL